MSKASKRRQLGGRPVVRHSLVFFYSISIDALTSFKVSEPKLLQNLQICRGAHCTKETLRIAPFRRLGSPPPASPLAPHPPPHLPASFTLAPSLSLTLPHPLAAPHTRRQAGAALTHQGHRRWLAHSHTWLVADGAVHSVALPSSSPGCAALRRQEAVRRRRRRHSCVCVPANCAGAPRRFACIGCGRAAVA